MGKCSIQIVVGPAGSGKSTYCHVMQEHAASMSAGSKRGPRRIHVLNLDPAAEHFRYDCCHDVRQELISVTEVMTELGLGPNGALVYCMEYMVQHFAEWLYDILTDEFYEEDTVLFDCPGQVELYTHVPILKSMVQCLQQWGYEQNNLVTVFCVDASFVMADVTKFLSGSLLALQAMIALELPHVNVLTKADLIPTTEIDSLLSKSTAELAHHYNYHQYHHHQYHSNTPDPESHSQSQNNVEEEDFETPVPNPNDLEYTNEQIEQQQQQQQQPPQSRNRNNNNNNNNNRRRRRGGLPELTNALCQLLEDYSMVSFLPLNIKDEESIAHVLATVDHAIQFGEDFEVRDHDNDDDHDHDDDHDDNDHDES